MERPRVPCGNQSMLARLFPLPSMQAHIRKKCLFNDASSNSSASKSPKFQTLGSNDMVKLLKTLVGYRCRFCPTRNPSIVAGGELLALGEALSHSDAS